MIDLGNQEVSFECPKCGFPVTILLKQAADEETVICPGCLSEIKLQDEGGSTRRAETEINQALEEFRKRLRKLGR